MSLEENYSPYVKPFVALTDEEYDMVQRLAEAGIFAAKIADILQKDKRLFMMDWKRKGTHVFNAYYSGLEKAKADVNAKTLDNAKGGNLTAAQRMDKIWEEQRLNDLKEEIFNSE